MDSHFSRLLCVVAVATLPLGACMSASEIAASDAAACRSRGAKPRTPAYAKCLEDRKALRRVAAIENQRSMQRMQWEMQQSAIRDMMRPRF
jgi:hypothetical protein